MWIAIGAAAVVAALAMIVRVRRTMGPLRAGDFWKVDVPRTVDRPLAMGTRLDAAAALKKSGVPADELRVLIDGDHDQELVDRYWRAKELAAAKVVS
jgi:hypothetical protein